VRAVLLAGGFGTRLRPLTFTRPKPLLPIANRPHLEHVLDSLARFGVDAAVLATSYLSEAYAGLVEAARARGMSVHVTHEKEPLDTAGAVRHAGALVAGEAFFVFNGDVLTDVDLGALAAWHRARGAEATIMLTPVEDPSAFGVVPTDGDGKVTGFIEKPAPGTAPTNLVNAGVYVFEPAVLDRIPEGRPWSAERRLFPELVADGALYGLGSDAYWIDIGTPAKYLQANVDALHGRYRSDAIPDPREGLVLAADGASVAAGARVSSVCLGAGAVVEEGATVLESVLLPGARVGRGGSALRSILGQGSVVAPGAHAEDATLGDGDVLGAP
jgi:mannose-1-phosphate guanylyltransferase